MDDSTWVSIAVLVPSLSSFLRCRLASPGDVPRSETPVRVEWPEATEQ